MKKVLLVVVLMFILGCTADDSTQAPQLMTQWAIEARASDAYGGLISDSNDDQSPYAATGAPDVPACNDDTKAWVISADNDGEHWLELTYDDKVYASKVEVYETLGVGFVRRIDAKNGNTFEQIWEGNDPVEDCPGVFSQSFSSQYQNQTIGMLNFPTDTIRVYIDTNVYDWNEIDAVSLHGYQQKWAVVNDSVVIIE